MSKKIIDNVYHINVPMKGGALTGLNAYLITGGERNLLIDAGFDKPESRDVLFSEMAELGADFDNTDIFLTHMHVDHSELAVTLNKTRGVKVYIGEADGERLKNLSTDNTDRWNWSSERLTAMGFSDEEVAMPKQIGFVRPSFLIGGGEYTYVYDGDKLYYGGYELVCISAAGHSPGQTCLYIPEKKLVFFGDHVLYSITPNITSWDLVYNPLKDYMNNIRKFKNIEIEIPLPAHRTVTCNIYERLDQIIEHHMARLNETIDVINEHPGATAYEIASKLHWNVHGDHWDEFPLHQKTSAVGEVIAHLSYLASQNRIEVKHENGRDLYYVK